MSTKIKVDGLAFYASVQRPNQHSGAYSVDLVVDEVTSTILKEAGLKPAKTEDGTAVKHGDLAGDVFRFKRKTTTKDGRVMDPPGVVDSKGNPVSEIIGNGSKVRLYGSAYEYTFKQKKGISGGLNTLQVIDLVPYNSVDIIEDGYVATTPPNGVVDLLKVDSDDGGDFI